MVSKEHILKGTTTIGLKCKDGVILLADKRATAGHFIADKNAQKVHAISDNIAVTTAGGVSDNQLLTKLVRAEIKLKNVRTGRETLVKEAANLLASMVFNNIRTPSMVPGITHLLLGGKDEYGYHLYDIYPDGSLTNIEGYVASGSGSTMAYGVLESFYKKDMSMDEAIGLGVKALTSALRRDSASGNGFVLLTITEEEGMKILADKDIDVKLEL